jgi:hypothetical protein
MLAQRGMYVSALAYLTAGACLHMCVCGREGPEALEEVRWDTPARSHTPAPTTQTNTNAHRQAHKIARMDNHTHTHKHIGHKHANICARGHTHRFTHKHAHHRNQHVRTHASACTNTHTSARTYTRASAHTPKRPRTRTHTGRERTMHMAESNKCARTERTHMYVCTPPPRTSHKIPHKSTGSSTHVRS